MFEQNQFIYCYELVEDEQYKQVLDAIADAPWDFHHDYEIFDVNTVSDADIKCITRAWANNMQRDSAWAAQQAGEHHAKLLKAFQHKLERAVERAMVGKSV